MKYLFYWLFGVLLLSSCQNSESLPYYGKEAIKTETGYDTILKTVKPFEFIDQKGMMVNNETVKGKIFVVDFFFTSCPSICPVMTKHMLQVHDEFAVTKEVNFISHTIDPKRDSIQQLDQYAEKIDIQTNELWHFVTGEKEDLYQMAENYMIIAFEDDEVPGGFEHSGYFILVDKEQYVRGYYDGTDAQDIDELISDIEILLNE